MSVIVYKQNHMNVRTSRQGGNVPRIMTGYVNYIATRPGVMTNGAAGCGLFGRTVPGDTQYFKDSKEIGQTVYGNAVKGTTFFRAVISRRDADAADAGIGRDDRKGWERYVEGHIAQISGDNDIKTENLAWVAAAHLKNNCTSHVHVVFWDRSEESRNHVPATDKRAGARLNAILRTLIKETFPARVRAYMEERGLAYHGMRDMTAEVVYGFAEDHRQKQKVGTAHLQGPLAGYITDKFLGLRTVILHDAARTEGRLPVYDDLDKSYRGVLREMARRLITEHPQLNAAANNYVMKKTQEDGLHRMHGAPPYLDERDDGTMETDKYRTAWENRLEASVEVAVARRIFNCIKRSAREETDTPDPLRLITSMLRILSRPGNLEGPCGGHIHGELSKLALKEKWLESRDRGYEH